MFPLPLAWFFSVNGWCDTFLNLKRYLMHPVRLQWCCLVCRKMSIWVYTYVFWESEMYPSVSRRALAVSDTCTFIQRLSVNVISCCVVMGWFSAFSVFPFSLYWNFILFPCTLTARGTFWQFVSSILETKSFLGLKLVFEAKCCLCRN